MRIRFAEAWRYTAAYWTGVATGSVLVAGAAAGVSAGVCGGAVKLSSGGGGGGIYSGPLYPQATNTGSNTALATMRYVIEATLFGRDVCMTSSMKLWDGQMTETEFLTRCEAILDGLESQADDWISLYDLDIDAHRSGNVLTLIFDNATQVVVNSQAPMQEMWVAAPSGGFHYRFDGDRWNDTRGGPHMAEALSQIVSEVTGQAINVLVA